MVRCPRGAIIIALCGVAFFPSLRCDAQPQQVPNPQAQHAVFVFLQRTSRHVQYSKRKVFQELVEDVFGHLNLNNVSMARDEFGGRRYSEEQMPLETVWKIARDSKADSMLYLEVDRPFTKWIQVVAKCYDSSGKLLWSEEAASGGGLSGGHGLRVTLDRLHQRLDRHLGQEGLPLKTAEPAKGESQ